MLKVAWQNKSIYDGIELKIAFYLKLVLEDAVFTSENI